LLKSQITIHNELSLIYEQNKNIIKLYKNKIDYNVKYKEIYKAKVFFNKSSILVDNDKIKFNNLFTNLNSRKNYLILLNGYSSKEDLISNNTFSNNFQLSYTRSLSVKKALIEELIKHNLQYKNFKFLLFANSNSKFNDSNLTMEQQRYCEIKITQY